MSGARVFVLLVVTSGASAQPICKSFSGKAPVCCPSGLCPSAYGCSTCSDEDFKECIGSNDPNCRSGGGSGAGAASCPSAFPKSCGNGRCCDSAHPNCCSDGCCDTAHPYCCGNGRCCDPGHPYCCANGSCSRTPNGCPAGGCPKTLVPAIAAQNTTECCPIGRPFLCNDGSCDSSRNCHGVGLLGTPAPGGGGGGSGPFACAGNLQCSSYTTCPKCKWRVCACTEAATNCVRGWYETTGGRTFACGQCTSNCTTAATALINSCCQ